MYLTLCLGLVFLSGFTGLVYQVTWQSYLAYHLGSNALATTLVLAVFFSFLSVGYFAIGRSAHRFVRNKLWLYGILEGLIGAWCLLSPEWFRVLAELFTFHVASPSLALAVDLLFTALFIGFPTFLMGGTIPVLTDALTVEFEAGHRTHALIYGTNTAGAFLGALAAGFVLIESLGLPRTLVVASCINLALCATTFVIARVSRRSEVIIQPTADRNAAFPRRVRVLLWGQSFLSGFYVFSLENLLIRMAGISLGSTTYTFTIIVASFVLAIALGSLSVSLFRRIAGFRFFVAVQSLLFATVAALYFSIPIWPEIFHRTRSVFYTAQFNHGLYWGAVLCVFMVLLVVPVGLMGMNLPLLFNYLRSRGQYLSEVVGQIYAVNSLGSALGAVIGGYWLFYYLDSDAAFRVSLALVALTLPLLIWLHAEGSRARRIVAPLPLLLVLVVAAFPGWDERRFAPGLFLFPIPPTHESDFGAHLAKVRADVSVQFHPVSSLHDPGAIVDVMDDPRGRVLFVNGKPDSHTTDDRVARTLTALSPISIAPKIERIFIIGLGAGLSTSVASQFEEVRRIEVAEISQGVIDSLPYFAASNPGLEANRAKVEIVRGDARQVLLRSEGLYDLILSEPSSTWVAGVEKLFALDFYRRALEKLEPEGLYAQWLMVGNMDEDTFRTILTTFTRAFPWASAWSAGGGTLTLLGSRHAPEVDFDRVAARYAEQEPTYSGVALDHPLAILGNQLLAPATIYRIVAGHESVQSLERPLLAYRSGRAFFSDLYVDLDRVVAEALPTPLSPNDPAARFLLDAAPPDALSGAYFAATVEFGARTRVPWNFVRTRNRWLRALSRTGGDPQPLAEATVRQAEYLLSDAAVPPPGGVPQLLEVYPTLKLAQLPVRTEKLVGAIDAACELGDCRALQLRMLQSYLTAEELDERGLVPPGPRMPLPSEATQRIPTVYEETFHGQSG